MTDTDFMRDINRKSKSRRDKIYQKRRRRFLFFDLLLIILMVGVLAPFIMKKDQNKTIYGYKMSLDIVHTADTHVWQIALLPQKEPLSNELLELVIYLDDTIIYTIDDITSDNTKISTYSGIIENLSKENKIIKAELTILDETLKQSRSIEVSYITSNPLINWFKEIFIDK